jgi:hypothetical protein
LNRIFSKSLLAGATFFGTALVLSIGSATWNSTMPHVGTGSGLTSTGWNTLVDNISDLYSRLANFSFSGGYVGIGKTPIVSLDVNGPIMASSSMTSAGAGGGFQAVDRTAAGSAVFYRQGNINRLWDSTYGDVLSYNTSGNVGIGTTTPNASYKLDVNGAINATGLYVNGTAVSGGVPSQYANWTLIWNGGNPGYQTAAWLRSNWGTGIYAVTSTSGYN